jgi:hypothetical protein
MATNQFDRTPDPEPLQANSERTNASELSASAHRTGRSQLEDGFQPCKYSVICGRGKSSYNHIGNHRLRMLASTFVADYYQAGRKLAKSTIVSNIVAMIRKTGGRFCKYEKVAWFEVGDYYAREKVSAFFRDMLPTNYRSSAKAKTARRRIYQKKQNETQTQQDGQQLVEGNGHTDDSTEHSDDFSTSSYGQQLVDGTGNSDDGIGDLDDGIRHSDDFSMSSSCSGSSKDSLGFDHSMEVDFFDIDVF